VARNIDAEIERLSKQRQKLWAEGGTVPDSIANKLRDLYEEKRRNKATHGTKRGQARIVRDAATMDEIDRLMTT
jgi:hypothetical protein